MKEAEETVYFFDTSAFVKRYHQEIGTEVVDAAFDEGSATKLISDLGVIEFYSAFARKARMGEITEEDFRETAMAMAWDVQQDIVQLVSLDEEEKGEAAALIEEYGVSENLRTLDALQLAVIKQLGPQAVTEVYCADHRFAAVIKKEGFSVVDPEQVQ